MARRVSMNLAMAGWENGRTQAGPGVKIGGLGAVMEELPEELISAADRLGIQLRIEILTPCFAHYDRRELEALNMTIPVVLDGHGFEFSVYRHELSKNLSLVYFWDEGQLHWTNARAIYPDDPEVGFKMFATVSQAMAGYIKRHRFHTVHSHDYHVGMIPFYLGDEYLESVPHHFTIHNATYQGTFPVYGRGYERLDRINLPGSRLFHQYFDHFDHLNFMKGAMIKTHETGGKVTTVSGDLGATWGYAAELRESSSGLIERARALKPWGSPGEVFTPNRFLDVFEHIPLVGITNGLADRNRPENLRELKAEWLRAHQSSQPAGSNIYRNRVVQEAMLSRDHSFSREDPAEKRELKRLLHLEAFNDEPSNNAVIITVVGRLVEQKNLGMAAEVAERALHHDDGTRFAVLASAPDGDQDGKRAEDRFRRLAARFPQRFFFRNDFNPPLAKLILAGGDFTLIPSRFEPCGLVDYEASLLGNIVIAHRTGGLAKIESCGYLYDWLDQSDWAGEASAFFEQVRKALDIFRNDPGRHADLMQRAMGIDAGWGTSAEQYVRLYRFGLLLRDWNKKRELLMGAVDAYAEKLAEKEELFPEFYHPIRKDLLDQRLAEAFRKRQGNS